MERHVCCLSREDLYTNRNMTRLIDMKIETRGNYFSGIPRKKRSSTLDGVHFKKMFESSPRLSMKLKEFFYTELFMLLDSGIDLGSAIDIIHEGQKKEANRKMFGELHENVIAGKSLNESLEVTGQFSPYERYSVKIGEETGCLTKVLKELSVYYSGLVEQRRKITSAFSYPVVVICVAVAVIFFMVQFVVPMFEGVFARFGRELPLLTRYVLKLVGFLRGNTLLFLMVGSLFGGVIYKFRNRVFFKKLFTNFLLRVPVLGKLVIASFMNRFCQTMSLLVGSGIPLLRSVNMASEMITFLPLQSALKGVEDSICHGKSLYESLSGNKFFDQRTCSLIKLGEEINGLETAFNRLASQYREELKHGLELINKILEPILIVSIGFLVAIILIAMYLPMFNMGNSLYV